MFGWAVGGGRSDGPGAGGNAPQSSRSGLPVLGSGRIELELRGRVGGGKVEGWGLVEVKLALGRAASGRDAGRLMGQIEMEQDALHGGGRGGLSR